MKSVRYQDRLTFSYKPPGAFETLQDPLKHWKTQISETMVLEKLRTIEDYFFVNAVFHSFP